MEENSEVSTGMSDVEARIRAVSATLEAVAKGFPPESDEALAIRDAALAYMTVQLHEGLRTAYERLRNACDGEIPDDVDARLRQLGIDPDE